MESSAANDRNERTVGVVTGAASGIGEATARLLAARGWAVVLGDVQAERLQHLVDQLGPQARGVVTDVSDEDDVARLVDTAVGEFGRLDLMFNNAGVLGAVGPIAELRLSDAKRTLAVDLVGVVLGMKHAARIMVPQGSGAIVSTASPAGLAGGHGAHVYSAAKAGVVGLTQSVAAELRPAGVRVNAVSPGGTVTAMTAAVTARDPDDLETAATTMRRSALMGRPITPDAIARAVAFLASEDAEFITGETLSVDAGMVKAPGSSPFATGPYADLGAQLGPDQGGASPH